MENNIEDLIREDFHKREIQPNANALERLYIKLNNRGKHRRNKYLRIFAYAASIIGLVFILQFVFKNNHNAINKETISNVKNIDDSNSQINNSEIVIVEEDDLKVKTIKEDDLKNPQKVSSVKELIVSIQKKKNQSKILEDSSIDEKLIAIQLVDNENNAFHDTTHNSLNVKEVTDEELDALLSSAMLSTPGLVSDSIVINSQSMLYEIEVEINKPLPEKVLLTIKTGATTIKELVRSKDKENN